MARNLAVSLVAGLVVTALMYIIGIRDFSLLVTGFLSATAGTFFLGSRLPNRFFPKKYYNLWAKDPSTGPHWWNIGSNIYRFDYKAKIHLVPDADSIKPGVVFELRRGEKVLKTWKY